MSGPCGEGITNPSTVQPDARMSSLADHAHVIDRTVRWMTQRSSCSTGPRRSTSGRRGATAPCPAARSGWWGRGGGGGGGGRARAAGGGRGAGGGGGGGAGGGGAGGGGGGGADARGR